MTSIHSFARNTIWAFAAVFTALPLACSSPDPTNTTSSASTSASSSSGMGGEAGTGGMGGTGGAGGAAGMGGAGGGNNGPKALECQKANGICLGAGQCAQAGGTVAATSPGGCFFDDGPAECCVPPAPVVNPATCAAAGGLCAPIGGCLDAGGYFTSTNGGCDMGPSFTCCVPHVLCGDKTIECCEQKMTVYNPNCDEGKLVCPFGMPVPVGTCLMP